MMESDNDRTLTRAAIAIRFGAGLAAILLTVSGCVRNGPPAPVDDRSHVYNGRLTSPARSAATGSASIPSETIAPAPPSRGAITSAPLDENPARIETGVQSQPSLPPNATMSPEVAATLGRPIQAAPAQPAQQIPAKPPLQAAAPSGAAEISMQVAPGQTLYAISRAYNVPVRSLIELNDLEPPYALRSGQTIRVPNLPTYVVVEGDTLNSVSRRFGVGVRALAETNRLEPPYRIVPGSRLLIPRAEGETPAVATANMTPSTEHVLQPPTGINAPPPPQAGPSPSGPATPQNSPPDHVLRLPPGMENAPQHQPPPQEEAAIPSPAPVAPHVSPKGLPSRRGFLWPVQGEIASGFGPKPGGTQNDGVNIVAKRGTSVRAAEDGVVVYAGNELRGYGNLLLIRHANGWMTAYAHNDELLVGRGAHVTRGQTIAKVGGTGGVDSPQLHFEVRQGGRPIDPMQIMGPMGS
jgi:murein DD-endopeptidase MepM/ murein hydrolase activator NlpD